MTCPSDAEQNDFPKYTPSNFECVENVCASLILEHGQIGIDSNSSDRTCVDGLSLKTHSYPHSCAFTCAPGYESSGGNDVVVMTCNENATQDDVLERSTWCSSAKRENFDLSNTMSINVSLTHIATHPIITNIVRINL